MTDPKARPKRDPDPTTYCPNCGARGVPRTCKVWCPNPKCSIQIILSCTD